MEIWKDIEGFEGLYQVSNEGRVKSFTYNREKILRPSISNTGYCQYTLRSVKYLGHRLVAGAFISNPFNYPIINHKDNNRQNNKVENLEWCTQSYNCQYSYKQKGSNSYAATIDERIAAKIFRLTKVYTIGEIAQHFHTKKSIVSKIKYGHAWNQVTGLPRVRYYKLKTQSATPSITLKNAA